jgi:CHASE1-domain containing sensor protein
MEKYGIPMLITSIRRSITDLTKEGKLIKCDYSDRKEGKYGTTNRTWRYNSEYIEPLNPKK